MKNRLNIIPLEERIVLDAAAVAHVIYVNSHAASGGDGSSWAHAYNNLQAALANAAATPGPDQIWIAKGTYTPGANRSDTFNIPDQTSLYGGFSGNESKLSQRNPTKNITILSGDIGTLNVNTDNSYIVVTVSSSTATLDGLTISGAYNDNSGNGGGLLEQNSSSLTLSNMIFINDFADLRGGGIYAPNDQSLLVTNSQFLSDNANLGGGLYSLQTNTVSITGSSFHGDLDPNSFIGSAFYVRSASTATITGNTIEGNKGAAVLLVLNENVLFSGNLVNNNSNLDGTNDAGILSSGNQNITFNNNIISNNVGIGEETTGGLTSEGDSNAVISNNLFIGNKGVDTVGQTGLGGGAAVVFDDSATIVSNIFINNTSDYGGGIFTSGNGSISISKNVFTGNIANVSGGALNLGVTADFINNDFGPGDASVQVSQNVFSNNHAGDLGGAIASAQESSLVMDQNAFSFNTAARGGALGDLSSTTVAVNSNSFLKNSATQGNSVWLDGGETTVNDVPSSGNIIGELSQDNFRLLSNDIYIA